MFNIANECSRRVRWVNFHPAGWVNFTPALTLGVSNASNGATVEDRDPFGQIAATHTAYGFSAWSEAPAARPMGRLGYYTSGAIGSAYPGTDPQQVGRYLDHQRPDAFIDDTYGVSFQGIRTADINTTQWMEPDPFMGSLDRVLSQQPYMWNANDPLEFNDPTGYYSQPCTKAGGCLAAPCDDCFGDLGAMLGAIGGGPLPEICQKGLNAARQDAAAVARALRQWATLQKAASSHGISPALLAAIGVRESGFQNIAQIGGGMGRGVFQIDLGQNPGVSEAQAFNIGWAANFSAGMLASNMHYFAARFPSFTSAQLMQATAASYNIGRGGISGNPATIDRGTTGNNYGSNVMDLMDCFN